MEQQTISHDVFFPHRFQVLLLSSAAIGGSLVTTFSCQFFTYQALNGEAWAGLEGPFQDLPEASVGLFSYSESIASTDALGASCERYNDWKYVGQSRLFQVAQIASMCAPILAFLAWVQILVEFLCCRLYGGLCLMSTLFLLAAGAQACTFLMLADKQFWYVSNIGTRVCYSIVILSDNHVAVVILYSLTAWSQNLLMNAHWNWAPIILLEP